jgi:hypothetical protein
VAVSEFVFAARPRHRLKSQSRNPKSGEASLPQCNVRLFLLVISVLSSRSIPSLISLHCTSLLHKRRKYLPAELNRLRPIHRPPHTAIPTPHDTNSPPWLRQIVSRRFPLNSISLRVCLRAKLPSSQEQAKVLVPRRPDCSPTRGRKLSLGTSMSVSSRHQQ